ncbi:type II secretion system protein [Ruminococcus sp.]|uniref:type II secretion system protein n=1 Tax=Ruminococcus sp. TaxID=41978 RepID=UPI0025889335|nr:type II secretion system protein [Ruminococcus sp.]MCR5021609.1 type II secretion system GspH family protein [Ruminococcus sp.]
MKNSNKKGFTLVELVVVIAIIGVLAAILVPSMMGYVKKSRLKTANGNAKTAYNAVAEYAADQETQGTPVDWSKDGGTFDASTDATGIQHEIYKALASNGNEAGEAHVGSATINNEATFFVQWHKTSADDVFGQYPEAIKSVDDAEGSSFKTYVAGGKKA